MPNYNQKDDSSDALRGDRSAAELAAECEHLRQENASLHEQLSDLQRRMGRYGEPGEGRAMSGMQVSISEREELLVEAERIAHMGSWVWDIEGNTVAWSDELFRILGYDPETEPATHERFFAAIHPMDRERVRAGSTEIVATGILTDSLFRVVRRDGATRYVMAGGAAVFDGEGKLRRVVGTILDITERHVAALDLERAHRQLKDAQAQAQLGSWSRDMVTGERDWSLELYRILGVDVSVLPSHEAFFERIHPDDHGLLLAHMRETEVRAPSDEPLDVRAVRPDGEIRNLRIRADYDCDDAGRPITVRGVVHDVTEFTALQKRLALAERMEMVGRLAGGIAHDFNNIMTVIHGGAELLASGDWTPGDLEILAQMKSAVTSARDLTTRLLAFGRQSALRLKLVDPNQIVRDTVRLVTRIIGEHVTVELSLDERTPNATLDSHLVSQALINLVINARDAMPHGGRITISTRRVLTPDGLFAEIGVRDSGPGIADELRDKVFEPFFTTKHEGHGTGLGLAMVQGAVEQLGGSITLDTSAAGTQFLLHFPASTKGTLRPGSPLEKPVGQSTRRLRILLVEDQKTLAAMVRRLLERAGHQVHVCTTPSAAIAHYRVASPEIDLVLSDMLMPELSGLEMVERLQAIAPLPRVVFMSGYGAEVVRALGPDQIVLAKPFTNAELLAAIERALRD